MSPRLQSILHQTWRALRLTGWLFFLAAILSNSQIPLADTPSQVRTFTRPIEYDFVAWTLNALGVKLTQFSLGAANYLSLEDQKRAVLDSLTLVAEIQRNEARLYDIYTDPAVDDPLSASADVRAALGRLQEQYNLLGPLAESIVQSQLSHVLADLGFTLGGQPIPPVLYHSTPLPLALIVSPRETIRQIADINLVPDLSLDKRAALEDEIDHALNVSTLTVPIGGIGFYPTMIYETASLNDLAAVVAHEWIHNYLTLRPLGISYLSSPELRTMNETAASIAGNEIGAAFIARYYPELVPPPSNAPAAGSAPQVEEPAFNYNAEMRITRLRVDELLAAGQVEEAEAYMEMRRRFLWDHGYHIRKLNQAFFAFYGAYADQPGGAAGEDPVGAAVRTLRAQSSSLADFIHRIAWITSFAQLQEIIARNRG